MSTAPTRPFGRNYAFIAAAVGFLVLLIAAGTRGAPSVLIQPLEGSLGWSRDTISLGAAIGILLYGLVGPFSAALMERFGIRRVLVTALVLISASTAASWFMTEPWQFILTWGVLTGLGCGCMSLVLGSIIVNRWFTANRGLMMGILTASFASGSLIFLPAMAAISTGGNWQPVVLLVAIAAAALIPLVLWLLPEYPARIGLAPYGGATVRPLPAPATGNPFAAAITGLIRCARHRDFWFLAGGFFICGFTTNGLVGTHLISFCGDMGIPAVTAAGLVAVMGIFDLFGTTGSGWLTDRYDPRKLLFIYYSFRGLSLIFLPYTDFSLTSLSIFAVFYGLDWIATVPPTVRLATESFGEKDAAVAFGWISAAHQIGAASAAFLAGYLRTVQGTYFEAFILAGLMALIAAVLSLMVRGMGGRAEPAVAA
jgi:MFS family permease